MTNPTMVPGPRQTIDRVKHPSLGEGIAVYRNGPAYFQADSGEVVMMASIGFGGCGKFGGAEYRSYVVATGLDGSSVELDTTKRDHGDRHDRRWHPHHGEGWLVKLKSGVTWPFRFDPDEGKSFTFNVDAMAVGRPGALKARKKVKGKVPPMSVEDEQWVTYTLANGEIVAFRREPPPVEVAAPVVVEAVGQLGLGF